MTTYTEQLRRVPGLGTLPRADLADVAKHAERVDARPGDMIVGPGDRWTGTCIVESGEAVARCAGWTLVLPAGSRIVRFDAAPAALALRARTDVRALLVPRNCRPSLGNVDW